MLVYIEWKIYLNVFKFITYSGKTICIIHTKYIRISWERYKNYKQWVVFM